MDSLSFIPGLSHTQVHLETRCLLAGSFAVRHEQLPAGEAAFHLLLQGQCQIQIHGGPALRLQAGDLLLLTRGQAHTTLDALADPADPRAPCQLCSHPCGALTLKTLSPLPSVQDVDLLCGRYTWARHASGLLMHALPPVVHVSLRHTPVTEALRALADLLRAEAGQPQPGTTAIVNALGQTLLTSALRVYTQQHPDAANLLALACDPRIGPSIQAVMTNPAHPWTLQELGDKAAMSRATYARQFKARAGDLTVGDFLARVRMTHAALLLAGSTHSLADVAAQSGYQSEAAFSQVFKRLMGDTPGRWRQRHVNAPSADQAASP
ncbi:MAG: AraC family transcriptional regulator [Pseudomonadota bacterium]|nr:AraC family transcriptional regulator [Pseudomonadota bacterium]